tara:strand:+ start:689 stop:1030 length:342 start_codon:yes stop_codon:yes gene_type:complete
MALPTGSGSEILGNIVGSHTTAATTTILTVPALHIYTILSMSFCRNGGTANTISIHARDSADRTLVYSETLSESTFVWNDRLVLMPADSLKLECSATAEVDFWISYIDQNWED